MDSLRRFGLWTAGRNWPDTPAEVAAAAAEIEQLGFGSLWIGGSPADDLALPEAILAATSRLIVGTSIVDIWRSDPAVLQASFTRIDDACPGRFVLGLGMGHAPATEATGQRYVRPLTKLRGFLGQLPSVPEEKRMLAALGPKALGLAAEASAGALPYLVPPEHTADARRILGPDRLLVPEHKIILSDDADTARATGRKAIAHYLALPNYTNNLRRYGMTDEDFAGEGSDRWVDTLVAWGDDATVKSRVLEHFEAGADAVALQVLGTSPLPMPEIRRAAALFLS
ncbi:LLM class F420-dependent oxidoreductase [Actinoplanes sp. N902-109]|uniref:LLM class F420-dependent oxidoreductase n=1 Tax=Actinoplanes sp. (strain N902-109) TaxID=649831 RepID=UPI000329504A|nr:LLM class F420-dependent oxidoreductase [Actinoplanes sp. N902-109]AGL13586.1 hypothetical protein L083_0076 [Actinoplanes sp. N902-109]